MKQLWGCFKFSAILKLAMAKFLVDSTHYCTVMLKHWSYCALLRFKSVVEVPYRFRLQPFFVRPYTIQKDPDPHHCIMYMLHTSLPLVPFSPTNPPSPSPPSHNPWGEFLGGVRRQSLNITCNYKLINYFIILLINFIGEKFDRLVNWNWLLVKLWKNPKTCLNSIILGSLPYTWPLTHTSVLAAV